MTKEEIFSCLSKERVDLINDWSHRLALSKEQKRELLTTDALVQYIRYTTR